MGGSSGNQPPVPSDYGKVYQTGIDVFLKNLPAMQGAEQDSRATIDPQRIASQQALQSQFGPTQTQQQLDTLHQFDPESAAIRSRLGQSVLSDLNSGYNLPADYEKELTGQIRGAQTARGNALGTGAAGAEAAFKGKAALDLYQEHLANAGAFLSGPTPEQQSLALQAVQPDRSSAYTNPGAGTAGANFGLANYSNLLAQYQLSGQGGGNAWQRALRGASIGASQGSIGGPWGAIGGAAGGAIDGAFNGPLYQAQTNPNYQWSDIRLKKDIVTVGQSPNGHRIVEFTYKSDPQEKRYVGAIAQEVRKLSPEAVGEDYSGFLTVRYDMIDVNFMEVSLCLG